MFLFSEMIPSVLFNMDRTAKFIVSIFLNSLAGSSYFSREYLFRCACAHNMTELIRKWNRFVVFQILNGSVGFTFAQIHLRKATSILFTCTESVK